MTNPLTSLGVVTHVFVMDMDQRWFKLTLLVVKSSLPNTKNTAKVYSHRHPTPPPPHHHNHHHHTAPTPTNFSDTSIKIQENCNQNLKKNLFKITFNHVAVTILFRPRCGIIELLYRAHSGYGFSQWETTLQCNVVYHWLSPYPDWSPLSVQLMCSCVILRIAQIWFQGGVSKTLMSS